MDTTIKGHLHRSGDLTIIILAAISFLALLTLTAVHNPLVLGLLVPASVLGLRWQREALASREGMSRLRVAVAACLARDEATEGGSGSTARHAAPRLHLVAAPIE